MHTMIDYQAAYALRKKTALHMYLRVEDRGMRYVNPVDEEAGRFGPVTWS